MDMWTFKYSLLGFIAELNYMKVLHELFPKGAKINSYKMSNSFDHFVNIKIQIELKLKFIKIF